MKAFLTTTLTLFALSVTLQSRDQYTIDDLTKAAAEGNENRLMMILDRGVDINAKDSKGWFPISKAAAHGQVRILYLLKLRGADINATTTRRNTPLMFAASRGHTEAVRFLLNAGANTVIANLDLELPGSVARRMGYPRIAEMIYEHERR